MRRLILSLALAVVCAAPASAQTPPPSAQMTVRLFYKTPLGATRAGYLYVPPGDGPFPGVVIYSIAGINDLIDRLGRMGFAVMLAERRGMGTPDQYLAASLEDLENDALGALEYLRANPKVDPKVVGVIAQGGETMPGIPAFVHDPAPAFVVLMSPTGLPGDEDFRLEQTMLAQGRGKDARTVAAVNDYVLKLADIIKKEPSPALRTMQIQMLMDNSEVRLDQIAAFPPDEEDQVRFFASPWWREYFQYRPDSTIAKLSAPTLILFGKDDQLLPPDILIPSVRGPLERAPSRDATICLLQDRTQHAITATSGKVIQEWIAARVKGLQRIDRSGSPLPAECIKEEGR
jgi:uncharacterized protein